MKSSGCQSNINSKVNSAVFSETNPIELKNITESLKKNTEQYL